MEQMPGLGYHIERAAFTLNAAKREENEKLFEAFSKIFIVSSLIQMFGWITVLITVLNLKG